MLVIYLMSGSIFMPCERAQEQRCTCRKASWRAQTSIDKLRSWMPARQVHSLWGANQQERCKFWCFRVRKREIKTCIGILLLLYFWEIIVYSRSTINAYLFLLHEWWISLIKFMVGPTIHMKGRSTHLWYSEST